MNEFENIYEGSNLFNYWRTETGSRNAKQCTSEKTKVRYYVSSVSFVGSVFFEEWVALQLEKLLEVH